MARLPRFAILVFFAVPFVVAEPLKLFALLLMASGKLVVGFPLLIFSYLITFLLVERIYHAGREKLLSCDWFAWGMGYVSQIRERLLEFSNGAVSSIRSVLARVGF